MELAVADIDGEDLPSAAGDEYMGEAAGRGADIERDPAQRIEAEGVEGGRELKAAAGDVGVRAGADRDFGPLPTSAPGFSTATPPTFTSPSLIRSAARDRVAARPFSTTI